jgi:hypothetical protein
MEVEDLPTAAIQTENDDVNGTAMEDVEVHDEDPSQRQLWMPEQQLSHTNTEPQILEQQLATRSASDQIVFQLRNHQRYPYQGRILHDDHYSRGQRPQIQDSTRRLLENGDHTSRPQLEYQAEYNPDRQWV